MPSLVRLISLSLLSLKGLIKTSIIALSGVRDNAAPAAQGALSSVCGSGHKDYLLKNVLKLKSSTRIIKFTNLCEPESVQVAVSECLPRLGNAFDAPTAN